MSKQELVNEAKNYLNNSVNLSAAKVEELLAALKKEDQFAYATEVTIKKNKYEEIPDHEKQGFVKMIYKDHSLPSAVRFGKALAELKELEKNKAINTCETFGLKGAIYKRRWEFDGQFKNLLISLKCYKQGYQLWEAFINQQPPYDFKNIDCDFGYTGINAAFVNELLAKEQLEQCEGTIDINDVKENLSAAISIRKFIIDKIADKNDPSALKNDLSNFLQNHKGEEGVIDEYFVYATLIEAYFGIFEFDKAKLAMDKMNNLKNINKWKTRSAAKQLIAISELQQTIFTILAAQNITDTALLLYKNNNTSKEIKNEIISTLLYGKNQTRADDSSSNLKPKKGKYGIGLSGGGHRAALYHIGVLASLAENDLLRHIEVISCVSGGSIAGTFYYLCLKNLLEKKPDNEITTQDYISIIKYMQLHFKSGVQKNLRSRMFANLFDNMRMMKSTYTRTHKMGELYEEYFYTIANQYDPLQPDKVPTANNKKAEKITMSKLIIEPADDPKNFEIQYDNWKRKNKVPQLVLNATSLNTGHNFQFTAKWMGVPPGNMQPDIDVKPRLRRMYYPEAPKGYQDFRLGYAVAASSCVPFVFRALPMKDLYQDMELQLIDGGYHENQGVAALLEQECKNLIISDGSGQLSSIDKETPNDLSVFYRADVVVQERVRELEFMDIKNRRFSSQIESISVVHLRKDLTAFPRNWLDCKDPPRKLIYNEVSNQLDRTDYGIDKKMQQQLSEVRTDLDSFNDTECYMLMYDGYRQMNKEIADTYGITTGACEEAKENWYFLAMTETGNMDKAEKLMPHSNENAFKIFRYWWKAYPKLFTIVLPVILLLVLILIFILYKTQILAFLNGLTTVTIIWTIVAIAAVYFWKKVVHILLAVIKYIIFKIHLHTFDILFLNAGKIKLKKEDKKK